MKDPRTNEGQESPSSPALSGDSPSFEEAFTGLDEAVKALEGGSLTLEEATNLYEEGMRLVHLCNELLTKAELRVTELRNAYGGYVARPPPEEEEDEA